MTNNKKSKLQLNTTSVRHLTDAEMKRVGGGQTGEPGYSYQFGACYTKYCTYKHTIYCGG